MYSNQIIKNGNFLFAELCLRCAVYEFFLFYVLSHESSEHARTENPIQNPSASFSLYIF